MRDGPSVRPSRKPAVPGGAAPDSKAASTAQAVGVTIAKENHPPAQLRNSGTNLQYVSTPKHGVADAKALAGGHTGKIKVRDGIVVLRNFLDVETQRWLAEICFSMGDEASGAQTGTTGFYQLKKSDKGNGMFKLNMGTRGRMIDSTSSFPPRFAELCVQCLRAAQEVDDTMPDMEPNTNLINFYKPDANFKWHKDSENPQLVKVGKGKPVVSFSIGLSCDFGYKDHYESEEHETVRLDSGDVFIFGGRSRMIVHSVLRVIPHTMPGYMRKHMREGRLNITFREVDGYLDPTQFPRYRVTYDIEDTGNG